MKDQIAYKTIKSIGELKNEKAYLDFIKLEHDIPTIFYHPTFLEQSIKTYLNNYHEFHFVLVFSRQNLIGFMPLILERKPLYKGGIKRFFIVGEYRGLLDNVFGEFFHLAKYREIFTQACHDYFYKEVINDWDIIDLMYVNERSGLFQVIRRIFESTGNVSQHPPSYEIQNLDQNYLNTHLSKRRLKKIKRSIRLLENEVESFKFSHYTHVTPELLERLKAIHRKRQESIANNRDMVFERKNRSNLMLDIFNSLSAMSSLDVYCLETKEDLIAFYILIKQSHYYISWITAFDPDFAKHSPATSLKYLVLEQLERHSEHPLIVSMQPGKTKMKADYANQITENYRYIITNTRSLKSKLKVNLWHQLLRIKNLLIKIKTGIRS